MSVKNQKLHEQFDAEVSTSSNNGSSSGKPIFQGISIFVDGFTIPSNQELKGYMLKHGGRFENYFSRHRVTHIICSNLPYSKIKNLRSFSGGLPVVKPAWLLDSVSANKLLNWVPYQLDQLASEAQNQPKLSAFFSLRSSPVSNGSMTCVSGEDPSLEGGTNNESDTSGHSGSMEHSRPCTRESDDNEHGNNTKNVIEEATNNDGKHSGGKLAEPSDGLTIDKSSVGILDQASPSRHSASVSSYNAKSSTSSAIAGPSNQHHSTLVDPNFVENYFKKSRLHFIGDFCHARGHGLFFFVSVVIRNHPELRDKPVAVCHSDNPRGTAEISSANYPARDYGVRAGIFVRDAKALCPHLVIFPYDFDAYEEVADQFYNILHKHCKKVQAVSCDEAFLEVTQSEEEDPQFLASVIRKEIFETTKCTASAGISGNLLMARLATRGAKPDGQCYIPPEKVDDYLHELSIKALPGIGHVLEEKLKRRQILTCGQLRMISQLRKGNHIHSLMKIDVIQADEPEGKCPDLILWLCHYYCFGKSWYVKVVGLEVLATRKVFRPMAYESILPFFLGSASRCYMLGTVLQLAVPCHMFSKVLDSDVVRTANLFKRNLGLKTGDMLWNYSRGVDNRLVGVIQESKSVGAEVNWGVSVSIFSWNLCKEVSLRLQGCAVQGRSFTLKIKKRRNDAEEPVKYMGHGDCENLSRSITVPIATDDVDLIRRITTQLFGSFQTAISGEWACRFQSLKVYKYLSKGTKGIPFALGSPPLQQVPKNNAKLVLQPKRVVVKVCYALNSTVHSIQTGTNLSNAEAPLDQHSALPPIGKSVDGASLGTVQGNVSLTLLVQEQLLHSVLVPNSHLGFIHLASKNEGTRPFPLDSASENEHPVADKEEKYPVEKIQTVVVSEAGPSDAVISVAIPNKIDPLSLSQVDISVLEQLPEELRVDILEQLPAHRRPGCAADVTLNPTSKSKESLSLKCPENQPAHSRKELWVGNPPEWVGKFKDSNCWILKILADVYYRSGSMGLLSSILQCILSEFQLLMDASNDGWEDAISCLSDLLEQYIKLRIETDIEEIYVCFRLLRRHLLAKTMEEAYIFKMGRASASNLMTMLCQITFSTTEDQRAVSPTLWRLRRVMLLYFNLIFMHPLAEGPKVMEKICMVLHVKD
ncbi:DNA-directed DNA polymerase [Actinidia rufa]|uniref:DNA repair protein REV1 n=1 Tax=Actinidia rufa TaxID=165716 RepID=A0A7J0F8S7_9ERIC|nr:DNA-directed DNA polymerase [Actinidia rufa]